MVFVVTDGTSDVSEWPSYHEARVAAEGMGPGFKPMTRRRRYDNVDAAPVT